MPVSFQTLLDRQTDRQTNTETERERKRERVGEGIRRTSKKKRETEGEIV